MKKNVLILILVSIVAISLATFFYFQQREKVEEQENMPYIHNSGETQGTTYSIIYQQPEGIDLHEKIKTRLHEFDLSLSSYIPYSIISLINRNDSKVKTDILFETMFNEAKNV